MGNGRYSQRSKAKRPYPISSVWYNFAYAFIVELVGETAVSIHRSASFLICALDVFVRSMNKLLPRSHILSQNFIHKRLPTFACGFEKRHHLGAIAHR